MDQNINVVALTDALTTLCGVAGAKMVEELYSVIDRAEKRGYQAGGEAGLNEGQQDGFDIGYDIGYSAGKASGLAAQDTQDAAPFYEEYPDENPLYEGVPSMDDVLQAALDKMYSEDAVILPRSFR